HPGAATVRRVIDRVVLVVRVIAQLHDAVLDQSRRRGAAQNARPQRRGEPLRKQRHHVDPQHRYSSTATSWSRHSSTAAREVTPIAWRFRIRDQDAEKSLTLASHPAQPNSSCHSVPYILWMNLLILRICWNCSSSRFTSCTDRPDPFAIRSLRDPLNTLGSARSSGVIESTIASTCLRRLSSIDTPCKAFALIPGKSPSTCFSGPMFCICFNPTRKSCRSMPFLDRTFCSRRFAASASTFAAAFPTRATTSPCPRIRPAMRPGSNGSSASVFSPTPTYLIGTPVTPL